GVCLSAHAAEPALGLSWKGNILTIHGKHLPGGKVDVWYLEAYCRPDSTDREWGETVIGHTTRLVETADDGKSLKLECTLKDGVVVRHEVRADSDTVRFAITAHNPTSRPSEAHWAQPCIRVGAFTGHDGPDP